MSFREETRAWLEDNCPPSIRTPMADGEYPMVCAAAHSTATRKPGCGSTAWRSVAGPRPCGPPSTAAGACTRTRRGSSPRRCGASGHALRSPAWGLSMIGPALLEFGSPEQCEEHVPQIVRGDIWWCQGYSEPGSGSDLAGLRTRAEEDGDDYIVNGSKIWTSGADNADWIFCLVRTDPKASKHDGITFLLFDMASPGVTVKPIRLISGASPVLRDLLRRRPGTEEKRRQRTGQGLDGGQAPAAVRAHVHRRRHGLRRGAKRRWAR